MTPEHCREMELLVQADIDGELAPAEAARLGAHLEVCSSCAALHADLAALSTRLRDAALYHAAPPALVAAVRATLAGQARPSVSAWRARPWRMRLAAPFGAGFAVAACVALLLVPPRGGGLPAVLVDSHIRALQPGHLLDVVSTDQHTVKPWFDGRLDFAPPVKDLAAAGFPLAGGRLDYLQGRPVAALVYKRRQHDVDLYVWPDNGGLAPGLSTAERSGYNVVRWARDGMAFSAVSDLGARELAEFAGSWQAN